MNAAMIEQRAEIEYLKVREVQYIKEIFDLNQTVVSKDKLIRELADALDKWRFDPVVMHDSIEDLLQRARAAVKCS